VKITSIETIPVDVPLKPRLAIRGSKGLHARSPFLIVKVHSEDGITGLGEVSATPRWSGEDAITAAHFIETLIAPVVTGVDSSDIAGITRLMHRRLAGNYFTKAAVEMALWDIAGKRAGKPVWQLLGGAARDHVKTKWSVSGVEPARAAEIAAWAAGEGFPFLKVKVGIDPEQDLGRVAAVREAVGQGIRIGVDANGGWSKDEAVEMILRLEELDLAFAEQPVPPGDTEAMREVRRRIHVPLIADESVYTVQDAAAIGRATAADAVSIYVGKSGGIEPAIEIARAGLGYAMAATVGSNLELGIGTAAMIHLGIAIPGLDMDRFPCDIIGPFYYEDSILLQPLPIAPGVARAPGGPGLGVELDEGNVSRYRVD
jgi:muconate cycloisomerase